MFTSVVTGSKISTSSKQFLHSDWLIHFLHLLCNCWTELHKISLEASFRHPLPSLCFSGQSETKVAVLASDWLRHYRLFPCNCQTDYNKTRQDSITGHPLQSLCFWGWLENQDGHPGLWLAETVYNSLQPLYGFQQNLTGCNRGGNKHWSGGLWLWVFAVLPVKTVIHWPG